MSRESLWSEITGLATVALATSQQMADETQSVIKCLKEGVSLPLAVRIINSTWGDSSQSSKLKVLLSEVFPKKNADLILHTLLPADELKKVTGELEEVAVYFTAIQGYIEKFVAAITEKLIKADFTEQSVEQLNMFRRNVILYTDFGRDYFYEVNELLKKEEITAWEELAGIITPSVETGDYLFIDDYKALLSERHKYFLDNMFYREDRCQWTLQDTRWATDRMVPHVRLPFLFAEWLNVNFGSLME